MDCGNGNSWKETRGLQIEKIDCHRERKERVGEMGEPGDKGVGVKRGSFRENGGGNKIA